MEEKIREICRGSMRKIDENNAPLIAKLIKELDGLAINDAIQILNDTAYVIPLITQINVN